MAMKKTTSKPPKASGTSAGKSNPKAAAKGKGSLPKSQNSKMKKVEGTVKKLQGAYDKIPKAYDYASKTPGAFVKGGPRKNTATARAKTVAREVRDIPTEIGTRVKYKSGNVTDGPKGNVKKQLKDVGRAVTKGKAGSTPSVIARSQSKDKYAKPRGATSSGRKSR